VIRSFVIAPPAAPRQSSRGNGVCLPDWENRLNGFSADNSYQRAVIARAVGFMWNAFWIFIGSGLGGLARWGASGLIANRFGETFPWGTLIVNVTGSFIIGLFATATGPDGRWLAKPAFRQFFMVGICGGYTTFSSFSLQTLTLAEDGQWFKAAANSGLSLVLCLVGVWLGHLLALYLSAGRQ
jgi:CrcB protein